MVSETNPPSRVLMLIALIQGLALLLLHWSIVLEFWPYESPEWLFAFYSLTLTWPTMLLLGLTHDNFKRFLLLSSGVALVAFALGFYVGFQASPVSHIASHGLLAGFILTMAIGVFKALNYSQALVAAGPITYSALFRWSWRNFLTLSQALLFTLAVWLVLLLWAGLFASIGIDFILDLFQKQWFLYPVLALANGFGVIIFRRLTHVIDSVTRLQQALMKFLLVLLAPVSVLFLLALCFTGLDALWSSGGSSLILWMQALMLFFTSAVYQDDPDLRPYGLALHRCIYIAIAILPIYSVLSFYGLSLRVDQYGWTLSRCWAFLIWFVLTVFSVGYLRGIVKFRDDWLHSLGRVNVIGGLLVMILVVLVNSPLLDFRKLTLGSQLARLNAGTIELDNLDVGYIRRHLGRPGYLALQTLKEEYGDTNPEFVRRIDLAYQPPLRKRVDAVESYPDQPTPNKKDFLSTLTIISGEPPEELLIKVYRTELRALNLPNINNDRYYLMEIEVNNLPPTEYLVLRESEGDASAKLYYWDGKIWRKQVLRFFDDGNNQALFDAVRNNDIEAVTPRAQDIRIGETYFRVR